MNVSINYINTVKDTGDSAGRFYLIQEGGSGGSKPKRSLSKENIYIFLEM